MGIVLMLGAITFAFAQADDTKETKANETQGGWATRALEGRARRQTEREARGTERTADTDRQQQQETPSEAEDDSGAQTELFGWGLPRPRPEPIVGTWLIDIPTSNTGLPPFRAYHTFADGGTFTEVSSLLAKLGESPAHGVWTGRGARYNLTFELFVFDPETKEPVGIIRVRVAIRLLSRDELVGDTAVDFIAPDGTVEENIDGGPLTGKRVKVRPVK
jgi:hypothetical protein